MSNIKNTLFKCENLFLIFCLFWGIVFLLVNPPFQAPDESGHFFKMWGYTQGTLRHTIKDGWSGVELPESISKIYNFYSQYVYSNKKIPLIETVKYSKLPLKKDDKIFVKFGATSYTPLSYFPSFIVLWIMKLLNIKPLFMMYILRFCSLLVYMALTYYAIRLTPCKKWMFLFLALLPINVYQAAAISTDGITLGFVMLFCANTLKLAFSESVVKINRKQILIWDILITCIGILKFAYFPLVLLYFLIPKTKFESSKLYYGNFAVLILVNFCLLTCFLMGVMGAKGLNEYSFKNKLLSSFEMIKKILAAPFNYILLVIKSSLYLKKFLYYNVVSSVGGNLVMIPPFAAHLTWFLMFLSVFCGNQSEKNPYFSLNNKAVFVIAFLLCHVLIMTSVYLIYQTTPYIVGIQGRYLTPLLPLLLLLFSFKKVQTENKVIPAILLLAAQFLLFMTFIIIIVYYY